MRVIRTEGSDQQQWVPCLCTHHGAPYAILSHRWLEYADHEVLFADVEEIDRVGDTAGGLGTVVRNPQYTGVPPNAKPGFRKLQGAARQALKQGYEYIWVDTACIDKSSSAELSEAINSMWKWYKSSAECFVYLADMPDVAGAEQRDHFAKSQWWTRGWTLQELLAPQELAFFSSTWTAIGRKKHMDMTISEITGIDPNVINGTITLSSVCIAQRMSWSSARVTSRIEDRAYALMGIFSVNMPLLYGEGEYAFIRLQQEIMKDSDDESIFAWKDERSSPQTFSGLLASQPSAFASCRQIERYQDSEDRASYSITNKGLSITLRIQKENEHGLYLARLDCAEPGTRCTNICIYLTQISETGQQYARVRCQEWAPPNALQQTSGPAPPQRIFVKQSHDQQPAYQSLDVSTKRIRLLRVLPTADANSLKLKLMEADIETSRYTAISYVWGTADEVERSVTVNSSIVTVRKNLFAFLQRARHELRNELFWIDAICIQMSDLMERNYQVALLPQIYSHATKVIVWLGYDTTRQSDLYQLSGSGSSGLELTPTMFERQGRLTERTEAALSGLMAIATHPYWSRLWVVQELFMARDIAVKINTFSYTIEDLAAFGHGVLRIMDHFSIRGDYCSSDLLPMSRLLKLCQTKEHIEDVNNGVLNFKTKLTHRPVKFGQLLQEFQHQKCTVPRDKVYGLLSMSDLFGRLTVDYSKPLLEVFFDVIHCLGDDRTLDILPILAQALELDLSLPAILQALKTHNVLEGGAAQYEFLVDAVSITSGFISSGFGSEKACTDGSDSEVPKYLAVGESTALRAGLAFTAASAHRNNSLSPNQKPAYEFSHTYIRSEEEDHSLVEIPRSDILPPHISAVLENTPACPWRLRITTDNTGLMELTHYKLMCDDNNLLLAARDQTGVEAKATQSGWSRLKMKVASSKRSKS